MLVSPSTASFSKVPVLLLAAAFACGIASDAVIPLDLSITVGASLFLAAVAFLLRSLAASSAFMIIAFVFAGAAAAVADRQSVGPNRLKTLYDAGVVGSGTPVEIEGVLSGRPEPAAEGSFLTIAVERLRHRGNDRPVSGSVRLFLAKSDRLIEPELRHGSRVVVNCILNREDSYLNPGVLRVPQLLDQIGIDAVGSIKSPLMIEHIADESVFLPLAWIYERRALMIESFSKNLNSSAGGIMAASLLGDKHFLDRQTAEVFREGGTFHVLVISGLHITFIGGILLLVIRIFTWDRWLHFGITASLVWGYTLAVGADVPVVRAAVMFTIVLYSYVLYRPGNMLNSLGLCAVILLAWRPADVFNASFHLTFVSVAAIVGIAYPLIDGARRIGSWTPSAIEPFPPAAPKWLRSFCETIYWKEKVWEHGVKRQLWTAELFKAPFFDGIVTGWKQKLLRFVFEGIMVSLIVQVCMLPLLVIYFHRISFISIFLNLWVGVLIAIESFAAVAGALLIGLSRSLALPFFLLTESLNWVLMSSSSFLTSFSFSSIRLPAYTGYAGIVYLIYFVLLLYLGWRLYKWDPLGKIEPGLIDLAAVTAFAIVLLTVILHPFSAPAADGKLRVDFLDVGQGDAAFVVFPDGRTMLIDAGGRMRFGTDGEADDFEPDIRRIGESVVSEYLWHRGYDHVDILIGTHADTDHIQGLADVAENFNVGQAFMADTGSDDADVNELRVALLKQGISISTLTKGDTFNVGDVAVEVVHPSFLDGSIPKKENDLSLVIRLIYGEISFLLTGDIESEAEQQITQGQSLTSDVIKVPHHGSRTSSTDALVNSVRPRIAVIPVGRRSPFGHPHREVVERWTAAGARVITTGERGMITIVTDGRDLVTETFLR